MRSDRVTRVSLYSVGRAILPSDQTLTKSARTEPAMIELKPGAPVSGLLQQLPSVRQTIANAGIAMNFTEGQRTYLIGVENLDSHLSNAFVGQDWHEQIYSQGYWAVRQMTEATPGPWHFSGRRRTGLSGGSTTS